MNILCAFQRYLQQGGCLVPSFSFWAGSEIQNNPKQIRGAGSFPVTTCKSSAYLFFGINSEAIYWKKSDTLKVLVHPRCVILLCTTPPVLHSEPGFFFFFCQAVGQEQILVRQLRASLLFRCRQLPVMKTVQWEPALKSQGRWCGNGVETARNLSIHTSGMGCTTSVILFKGICTVFERNCAYMCKQQGENNALEYTAYNWTKEDSELLISYYLVNAVLLNL